MRVRAGKIACVLIVVFHRSNRKVFDGSWGWRALRLLAKRSPHFFTYGNNPIARLPDYLEQMMKKMVKEMASDKGEEGGREKQKKGIKTNYP